MFLYIPYFKLILTAINKHQNYNVGIIEKHHNKSFYLIPGNKKKQPVILKNKYNLSDLILHMFIIFELNYSSDNVFITEEFHIQ